MSILDSLKDVFNKKESNKVVGIDIGSSSIKIVQVSLKKGIAVLDTFGEIALAVYAGKEIGKAVSLPEEKLKEALVDLMKEAQVDTNQAALAIPLKSTLMFHLKLPKNIEKSKLDPIVKMESRKYIPVDISEVQLDWSVIPGLGNKETEYYDVLVVAVHKETLRKYTNIAKDAGLELKFLEVETFATIRSVIKYERNTTAIIDIGSSITKFYIVEQGIIRKSHVINIGASKILSQFRGKESAVNASGEVNGEAAKLLREAMGNEKKVPLDLSRIIREVHNAIIAYQKAHNSNVSDAVITGGGSLFKDIVPYVSKQLSVNVSIADPFSKVSNPAFLDEPLKEAGPEFAVAVGIALRGLQQ